MTEAELWAAVLRGGAGTLALMTLIIWLGKGWKVWVWARELYASEKEREADRIQHAAEIDRMQRQHDGVVKERNEWRDVALDALGVAEHVTKRRVTDDGR